MRGGGIVNHFLPHRTFYYGDVVHFLGRQENEPKDAKGIAPWRFIGFERLFSALSSQKITAMRQHAIDFIASP